MRSRSRTPSSKAKNGQDSDSKYVLGLMFFYGMGDELEKNVDRAIQSFREASIEGHAKSQRNLAILLWNQKQDELGGGVDEKSCFK